MHASANGPSARSIAADDTAVVAIACYTETGRTAALLSVERPGVPIYAFVPDPTVRRSLNVRWGVMRRARRRRIRGGMLWWGIRRM